MKSLIYTVMVCGSPYLSQSCQTALSFLIAAMERGHKCQQVFFYHDSVYLASNFKILAPNQVNLQQEWIWFKERNDCKLSVCITAALERGILDESEAARYNKQGCNLSDAFSFAGLGEFVTSAVLSDRVIKF